MKSEAFHSATAERTKGATADGGLLRQAAFSHAKRPPAHHRQPMRYSLEVEYLVRICHAGRFSLKGDLRLSVQVRNLPEHRELLNLRSSSVPSSSAKSSVMSRAKPSKLRAASTVLPAAFTPFSTDSLILVALSFLTVAIVIPKESR